MTQMNTTGGNRKKKLLAVWMAVCCSREPLFNTGGVRGRRETEISLQQEVEQQLQKRDRAFEITANQRELAKNNEAGYSVLDALRQSQLDQHAGLVCHDPFQRFRHPGMRAGHESGQHTLPRPAGGHRGSGSMPLWIRKIRDAFLIAGVDYCVNTLAFG